MQDSYKVVKISRSWVVGALAAIMIVIGNPGTAVAQTITGNIGFGGVFTPANSSFQASSLASATAITWLNSGQAIVTNATGSFSSLTPFVSFGTLTNFVFNPLVNAGATLWQAGGFSFALNSIAIDTQNSQTLSLVGSGMISGAGFTDTWGTWNFTGNPLGSSFNFSAGTAVAAVPEPEIYAMMGIGMGVLGWAARRKKKQAASV